MNINNPQLVDYVKIMHRERHEEAHPSRSLKFVRASRPKSLDDLAQGSSSATGNLNLGSSSARSGQVVKAYWWVPAGFAVLVLLRAIIGA